MSDSRYSSFLAFAADLHVPLPGGAAALGSVMADFQRRDFQALAPTIEAVGAGTMPPVRRFWLERTKGGSKDTDCTVAMLWLMVFSSRAVRCQVIADDQEQASEVLKIVSQILAIKAPLNRLCKEAVDVQRSSIVSKRNGSVVEVLTRDATGSHGARPDLVLANELSHITDEAFASTVLDNADKIPTSVVVVATNAGFSDSWQYRWRQIAENSDRWHFSALAEPAPWVSEADLAESRLRNPAARYNRLWRGQWVRGVGDALTQDDITSAVTMKGPLTGQEDGLYFGMGLDLSTRRDHSALVVLAVDEDAQRVKLAWCHSWKPGPDGVDLISVQQTVIACHYRFNQCGCSYDPFQAHLLAQQCSLAGVPMVEKPFTATNLQEMASGMMQAFRERRVDLYHDDDLLADLAKLGIQDRGSFGLKLVAPSDKETGHADRAMAMAIAMPAALKIAFGDHPQAIANRINRLRAEQESGGRDDTWGAPCGIGVPGSIDSPYPDMRAEYGRKRR